MRELGLSVLRVRDRGDEARVEVGPDELELARSREREVGECLRRAGFDRFLLDVYLSPVERARRAPPGVLG